MKHLFFLLLFCSSFHTYSQDSLSNTFISQKYKGSIDGFIKDISSQIKYPQAAKEANYYSIAIVYLVINPEGVLEKVEILNRIKYGLGREVERVFKENKENWISDEIGYAFLISITFSLYDNYAKIINVAYPDIISENILINAYDANEDSLVRARIDYRKEFQIRENGFNKNITKEYYRKAKAHLNKLITMDPFYQNYYKSRLNIESYSKLYDYACDDLKLLETIWNIRVQKMKVDCSGRR